MPGEPRGVRAARGVVRPRLAARGCGHARPRDPDPGAAAAADGCQPRARPRAVWPLQARRGRERVQ